jgi:5'-3' exonuclease
MPTIHVCIDGSYYCFHRYYSIVRWWKNSHKAEPNQEPNQEENILNNPIANPEFSKAFFTTFKSTLQTIEKKTNKFLKTRDSPKDSPIVKEKNPAKNTHNTRIYVAKDCKRVDIWRNALHPGYKDGRKRDTGFGPFMKRIHEDDLFVDADPSIKTLYTPSLEADDCIALFIKKHRASNPEDIYFILSGDKDYLQLTDDRTFLLNLDYEDLSKKKSSTGCAEKDLFFKIVMGDPSDNIKSVLKKCGAKTAAKCYDDPVYFKERLDKEDAHGAYELNQKLIMFSHIPLHLQEAFYDAHADIFG